MEIPATLADYPSLRQSYAFAEGSKACTVTITLKRASFDIELYDGVRTWHAPFGGVDRIHDKYVALSHEEFGDVPQEVDFATKEKVLVRLAVHIARYAARIVSHRPNFAEYSNSFLDRSWEDSSGYWNLAHALACALLKTTPSGAQRFEVIPQKVFSDIA